MATFSSGRSQLHRHILLAGVGASKPAYPVNIAANPEGVIEPHQGYDTLILYINVRGTSAGASGTIYTFDEGAYTANATASRADDGWYPDGYWSVDSNGKVKLTMNWTGEPVWVSVDTAAESSAGSLTIDIRYKFVKIRSV